MMSFILNVEYAGLLERYGRLVVVLGEDGREAWDVKRSNPKDGCFRNFARAVRGVTGPSSQSEVYIVHPAYCSTLHNASKENGV